MRYLIQTNDGHLINGTILSHDNESIESTDLKFRNCILSTHSIYYIYCDKSNLLRNIKSRQTKSCIIFVGHSSLKKKIIAYNLNRRTNKLKKI